MSIRVLVADDQSLVRGGFRMLLSGEKDMEIVAEASNGLEAVEKAARFHPTIVLMDIRMPELDGLEATRRILAADAEARILILTTFDLDEYVYEALRSGASGFVLSASNTYSSRSNVVRIRIRVPGSVARMRRVASSPSSSGMRMSISTTVG